MGDGMDVAASTRRMEKRWLGIGDLRREIAHLQTRLSEAETIAERTTIMLREGDHRIKNSLQIVSSLLGLQASRAEDVSARDALRAAATRIQSIAKIHDALQLSDGKAEVDFGDVLRNMCETLEVMAGDPSKVSVVVDADYTKIPTSLAQPLVLAVNELVVNALRHAFPDGRPGIVRVVAKAADGKLRVTVADDGVGLPEISTEGRGYGMKLVRLMVEQIDGQLVSENLNGGSFTISAPLSA